MANWRYHSRAKINPYSPQGHGTCDRCSQIVTRAAMIWEMEYRGNSLMKTGFLVCQRCLDVPYQGRRPIIIPADPVPMKDPRPENFLLEENQGQNTTPNLSTGSWDESGLFWDNNITIWQP